MKLRLFFTTLMMSMMLTSAVAIAAPPEEAAAPAAEAAPAEAEETPTDLPKEEAAAATGAEAGTGEAAGTSDEGTSDETGGEGDDAEKPASIESDEEAMAAAKALIEAAKGGQWSLVAGLAIMLLIYLMGRMNLLERIKVPKSATPWVAAGTGILGYVAAALLVEGASLVDAISGGFMVGAAAVGLWEMAFKQMLKGAKAGEPEMEDGAAEEDEKNASEESAEDAPADS
jgi:hypothetical protein